MDREDRKKALANLIDQYNAYKRKGKLDFTSEETIRTWLNVFLEIFGWDAKDTNQILQEKILTREEKDKLKDIGSYHSKPDYTFKRGRTKKLAFLDAKDIAITIKTDKASAYQIKSYGWSISAPCSFISNFEEFAIYDCTYVPSRDQEPDFGRSYFTMDEYVANFDILEKHLLKENLSTEDISFGFGGRAELLRKPGLGIEIDIEKLNKLTIESMVIFP